MLHAFIDMLSAAVVTAACVTFGHLGVDAKAWWAPDHKSKVERTIVARTTRAVASYAEPSPVQPNRA